MLLCLICGHLFPRLVSTLDVCSIQFESFALNYGLLAFQVFFKWNHYIIIVCHVCPTSKRLEGAYLLGGTLQKLFFSEKVCLTSQRPSAPYQP